MRWRSGPGEPTQWSMKPVETPKTPARLLVAFRWLLDQCCGPTTPQAPRKLKLTPSCDCFRIGICCWQLPVTWCVKMSKDLIRVHHPDDCNQRVSLSRERASSPQRCWPLPSQSCWITMCVPPHHNLPFPPYRHNSRPWCYHRKSRLRYPTQVPLCQRLELSLNRLVCSLGHRNFGRSLRYLHSTDDDHRPYLRRWSHIQQ